MADTFGLELVKKGLVSRDALYAGLRLQAEQGGLLGTALIELGHLRRGPLLQALAHFLDVPPAAPSKVLHPDPGLLGRFDQTHLERLRALPYARGEGVVYLAFADPRQLQALQSLDCDLQGDQISLRVATERDLLAGMEALGLAGMPAVPAPDPPDPAESWKPPKALPAKPSPVTENAAGVRASSKRFANDAELDFSRSTGFDRERTAVFRLDDIARAEADGRAAAAEQSATVLKEETPEPSRRPVIRAPSGSLEDSKPSKPSNGPGEVISPTLGEGLPKALRPAASPADRFADEDEVAFSKATGFDKEHTALFRLEEIAAESAVSAPASADGSLPAPPDAPRIALAADKLFEAANEGSVARQLVKFYATYFPRVFVLTRHDSVMRGLMARGVGLSGPQVAMLRFSLGPLKQIFEEGRALYGPPPGGQELEPFYTALGEPAAHALLVPIPTALTPSWMLYADHAGGLERYDDTHDLERMAKEAGKALDLLRAKGMKTEAPLIPREP